MRRTPLRLIAASLAALLIPAAPPPASAQSLPPHAWLFGTWTGGMFPVSGAISAQACLAQPVVIFTKDVVLRATLTELTYTQRLIETARTSPGATEFSFVAADGGSNTSGLLGLTAPPPPVGFGCETPDVLHVQRRSDNEITFPGCAEFPNPLVRCPSR